MADALDKHAAEILAANAEDVARGRGRRHRGRPGRPADADRRPRRRRWRPRCASVADLPDPVGDVVRGSRLANGLELRQVRVPLGRRRHHLRGPAERHRRRRRARASRAATRCCCAARRRRTRRTRRWSRSCRTRWPPPGCRADAVQLVPGHAHESVRAPDDRPRPGRRADPARRRRADPQRRRGLDRPGDRDRHRQLPRLRRRRRPTSTRRCAILVNSKAQRTVVCNAAETLLVHADVAGAFLPARAGGAARGRRHRARRRARSSRTRGAAGAAFEPVTEEDWVAEYFSLDIAAGVVDSTRRGARRTSAGTAPGTPRRSSPTARRRRARSSPAWTRRP